jgi:hypothetical protein
MSRRLLAEAIRDFSGRIRDQAVDNIDQRHGYTMEFAPHQRSHRDEYDAEEARLAAELSEDPGALICSHEHRIHPLGGGIFVCFGCWAGLLL